MNQESGTRQKGFTLIELIIAFAILTMAFGSMATFAGGTFRTVIAARQDLIAANIAQEGIELMRNLRDQNWIVGNSDDDSGCAAGTWREGLCDGTYRVAIADNISSSPALVVVSPPSVPTLFRQLNGTHTYTNAPGATPTSFSRGVLLAGTSSTSMLVNVTVQWCSNGALSCPGRQRSLVVVDELRNWGGGNYP